MNQQDPQAAILHKCKEMIALLYHVTQADGSGNNVWQPGVFGWTQGQYVPPEPTE